VSACAGHALLLHDVGVPADQLWLDVQCVDEPSQRLKVEHHELGWEFGSGSRPTGAGVWVIGGKGTPQCVNSVSTLHQLCVVQFGYDRVDQVEP